MTFPHFYSIIINGSPIIAFSLTHGLCQGDPISTFVLILATKSLWIYLKKTSHLGSLKGLHPCGEDFSITHKKFVDDILLLCQVSLHEVRLVKYILSNFMDASGTLINGDNSNFFFFNTSPTIQCYVSLILGLYIGSLLMKYLGLPIVSNFL